jgi:hypothetical protein
MYLQSLDGSTDNVMDLLDAAEYFQVSGLKDVCAHQLIATITARNCLELLSTAYKYNLKQLKKLTAEILYPNRQRFGCALLVLSHGLENRH